MRLTGEVVLPLVSPDDARATAEAVSPYVDDATLVLVYVVEKGGGAPDKASVEQMEGYAEEVFEAAREALPEGAETETRVLYGTSVPDAVFDLCGEIGASAVALVPRETNSLLNLLVGDRMDAFVRDNNLPVVVLPSDD